MTITINEITSGIGLRFDSDIYLVLEYHHVKPGKGAAFVRVKMKNIRTGNAIERTFRTAEKLEEVALEERKMDFQYRTGDDFYFMDHDTYEQVMVTKNNLDGIERFLLENLQVIGLFTSDHQLLKVQLPNFIITQITESEPGIRGDSSRSGGKPAKIATGTAIQVPLFINNGDWIKIDTRSGEYVERVQK